MWRRDKERCFSPRGQLDRPREFNASVYHYRLNEGRRFGGMFNEGREGQALSLPPLGSTRCVLERRSRIGSRVGLEPLAPASTAPQRSSGMCGARGASRLLVMALGSGDAHRGARGPGALPTSSLVCTQRARARSPPMAATPIWERRVLRGGRALRGAALLGLLFMPGNDRAVIPGALDHSRAQDFDITVGRERSSTIKLPLRPPSWPRPRLFRV
ncbi:hypothetical protein NDU88_002075 [Pleurodeles waltl]|uniref:Uncharacterized protein n=1 Tax=Pleurodeles waltl TaxID=8319 RepID=A0AAV7T130_PLEWA|nr:hypothetical protein NDU88_002075 [Pleurodeles waltl]